MVLFLHLKKLVCIFGKLFIFLDFHMLFELGIEFCWNSLFYYFLRHFGLFLLGTTFSSYSQTHNDSDSFQANLNLNDISLYLLKLK